METVDLHIHSFKSDGTWKPEEIEKEAERLGLRAFAISDHDTTAGILDCKKCVPAVEISTSFDGKEIHLLGYFVDPNNSKLIRELDKMKISREMRVYDTLERAEKKGIIVTMDDVHRIAKGETIGRPHIAKAIMECAGIPPEKFDDFYSKGFKKGGEFYVEREKLSTTSAIEIVDDAGGIPVIAHPAEAGVDALLQYFITKGLAGIEVYYPYKVEMEKKVNRYKAIAQELDLLMTGGSDSHGPKSVKDIPINIANVPVEVYYKLLEHKEGL